jgi:transposase-like protein
MSKLAPQTTQTNDAADVLELFSNLGKQFWDDVSHEVARLIKHLIEQCLEEKRTLVLAARTYERTPTRRGRRGGSYKRRVRTRWGEIELRVPRVAEGCYDLEIIDRYGRRQVEVDQAIGHLWLAGISTRRLNDITEEIFGYGIRRSTISKITKGLDAEVEAFRATRIPDTVRYLLLDGIHAKVREIAAAGKVFPVAYGTTATGGARSWALCSPIPNRPRPGATSSPTSRPVASRAGTCA